MSSTISFVELLLVLACREKGAHEVGENWGPKVKEFLAAANIHNPAPWCAAFVNWCAEQAAALAKIESPLEHVPLQGYVQSYADYGTKHGWVVPRDQVRPGDLFCVWHQSLKPPRYGHIGIVTEVHGAKGEFLTIEGNSNDDGSREGYEVCSLTRQITNKVLFLRWAPTIQVEVADVSKITAAPKSAK